MHPSDDELRQRRSRSEDHFTERKTTGDSKDWVKTVVAFANSTPLDKYALLYIGVKDDGTIENNVVPEAAQNKLGQLMEAVFPSVEYTTSALTEDGRSYLCVIVPGSPNRPHFAGPSYVRVGARSTKASDEQFNQLVAQRNSKAYLIIQNIGKRLRVDRVRTHRAEQMGRIKFSDMWEIAACSQFSVTLRDHNNVTQVIGLERVEVLQHPGGLLVLEIRD